MENVDLLIKIFLAILTLFGTVISVLLIIVAYFLRKTDQKLDSVSLSVVELNKTMGIYITKHNHLNDMLKIVMQQLKEFKEFTYTELNKLKG